MIFRDFENQIKPLPTFNLNDIRKIDPDFHRPQLSDWIYREYIKPLAGGYYVLADSQIDESLLFMLANLIYEPSYISRESALAYYQVIPESVLGVTSISSRKTKQFDTQWGVFSYRSIKPNLMLGYLVIEKDQNTKFKIARLEKAVLDYLYWNPDLQSEEDLEGLRWNTDLISSLNENPLFWKYLKIFNSKTLDRRVKILMEYVHA
jgi:predicted transcriptional regulator of viral defense system